MALRHQGVPKHSLPGPCPGAQEKGGLQPLPLRKVQQVSGQGCTPRPASSSVEQGVLIGAPQSSDGSQALSCSLSVCSLAHGAVTSVRALAL